VTTIKAHKLADKATTDTDGDFSHGVCEIYGSYCVCLLGNCFIKN